MCSALEKRLGVTFPTDLSTEEARQFFVDLVRPRGQAAAADRIPIRVHVINQGSQRFWRVSRGLPQRVYNVELEGLAGLRVQGSSHLSANSLPCKQDCWQPDQRRPSVGAPPGLKRQCVHAAYTSERCGPVRGAQRGVRATTDCGAAAGQPDRRIPGEPVHQPHLHHRPPADHVTAR